MPWARFDDQMLDHEKIVAAGPLGFALHAAAIIYSNRTLSDGFVPAGRIDALISLRGVYVESGGPAGGGVGRRGARRVPADAQEIAEQLVELGLWAAVAGGWRVHDFLDFNPSRAEVEAEREKKREAGRAGAAARWAADRNGTR
jgi:hypothetical protein